jgi:hypothetical protein
MPIPALAGFGKAAQPLGVAADRFDGPTQGEKRAQAGSGSGGQGAGHRKREPPRSPWQAAKPNARATPARRKLVPRVRPTDAERMAGLWTPAAWRYGWHLQQRSVIDGGVCGGLRRRQASRAKTGVRGGRAPRLLFTGALRARAARRSEKQRARPLGADGARGQWTNVREAHTLLIDPE